MRPEWEWEMGDQMTERKNQRWPIGVLIACLLIVVFWEVMSNRSRRPLQGFTITAEDFQDFEIRSDIWSVRKLPINANRLEPNILALELSSVLCPPSSVLSDVPVALSSPVLVRLAHGYNMPDCMRIKGYDVGEEVGMGNGIQIWRLVSSTGDVSIWVTSMLRAGDFGITGIDIRSMTFPKIGTPDDPSWLPQGMTKKSLRNPIRNFRWMIRSKWNNSRSDIWTFLKLKQPAWADDSMLTLVSAWKGAPIEPSGESVATLHVVAAHEYVLKSLQERREDLTRRTQSGDAKGGMRGN